MDRSIVRAGQNPRTADLLVAQRAGLIALAELARSLLGKTDTMVSGLVATPDVGLTVAISSGAIYELEQVDATDYGSLTANTTDIILKQGLQLASTTLAGFAAPGTVGQSINYLVEAQYQDADTTPVVLKYWNAANPTEYVSGAAENTIRAGIIGFNVKAGAAATTGSQATPSATAGWVGLYAVTVDNGQATILPEDIVALADAPFLAGLLNSHHDGTPGQAPQIIVGPADPLSGDISGGDDYELQGVAQMGNLPASDTIGRLSAMQIYAGNPNGNLAGNAAIVGQRAPSMAWSPSTEILWACVVSGDASTAEWVRIPKIPSQQYTYINSSQTLGPGMYIVDTSASAVTITIENPLVTGDNFTFVDFRDTWANNHLVLVGNGSTILGSSENMVCDVNGMAIILGYAAGDLSLQ